MSLEDVRSQLELYSKLTKTLEKIHNQGFYSLFQTSFQSLYSQDKTFATQEFKQCLKIIVGEMIESIWNNSENRNEVDKGALTWRNTSTTPKKVLRKSVNSYANLKHGHKIPGNAIFNKEKRSIQKEIPVTPGPGDYIVEGSGNRSKSPSAVFSKEKRSFDIAHKESPGPSAYSPCSYLQSKF